MKAKYPFWDCILLSALLLAFSPSSIRADTDTTQVKRFELVIVERKVQIKNKTIRVNQGDTVELVWTSDEAAELHLHGYDMGFEISPEALSSLTFKAHTTGRYPVTSHGFAGEHGDGGGHGHAALLYIEVYPD